MCMRGNATLQLDQVLRLAAQQGIVSGSVGSPVWATSPHRGPVKHTRDRRTSTRGPWTRGHLFTSVSGCCRQSLPPNTRRKVGRVKQAVDRIRRLACGHVSGVHHMLTCRRVSMWTSKQSGVQAETRGAFYGMLVSKKLRKALASTSL